ncbi:hypothetical protein HNQ37_000822 [Lactovum miscens]|uniref:DUF1149 domain-containing protein n=2 Tax=Lactovum miscens TaxID=190387 RepID=A0A841C8M5_9LACT|nr:hypothetical protein [Lactovum miscens]
MKLGNLEKMELSREKEFVQFYHYDARNLEFEKEQGKPETQINVQLQIISNSAELNNSQLQLHLSAIIVIDDYVLSAGLSQLSQIEGRVIESQEDFSQEEMQELAYPLFDLLQRLTYEVTEVALDKPGLKLEF